MKHTLKLNNGLAVLTESLLAAPDGYTNVADLLRGAKLLTRIAAPPKDGQPTNDWMFENEREIEITEQERDLLKAVVTKHVGKIPASAISAKLLEQLGFDA